MKKINILYIIPRLAKAGTEKHLLNLACGLNTEEFDITVCCLFKIGEIEEKYTKLNFKILCLHRKGVYDIAALFYIYRFIKREKYDIVHTYLFGFHYLATIPAKIAGIPIVISSRRELATWKKNYHHVLENLSNIFTDKVIANSEAVKEFSLQDENLAPDKIITIYNGIDLQEFQPYPKNGWVLHKFGLDLADKIIGMVANFSAIKDHNTMLKSIIEIRKIYPNIRCLLVGDGPLKKDIERRAEDLKLEGNIKFIGQVDNIAPILNIIDVFVLTSISEGLPNAILEAMACEVPVVSTKVGGIPEVLEDSRSGILVKSGDYQMIADAVITLLKDGRLKKQIAKEGRKTVEQRFGLDKMLKNYEDFYKQQLLNV